MTWVLLLAAILTAYLGFALLALSQDRNWSVVAHASRLLRPAKPMLRGAGYILLACSLAVALWRDGPGFGSLLWVTLLSVAACAVVLTLSWRPGWLRPIAVVIRALASRRYMATDGA